MRRHALLIGAGLHAGIDTEPGMADEVLRLRDALVTARWFAAEDIATLADTGATRNGIEEAVQLLQRRAMPEDFVLIYLAASSLPEAKKLTSPYLASYDRHLTAGEVHRMVSAVRARRKLLILDASPSQRLIEQVRRDAGYTLLLAASPGQGAWTEAGGARPGPDGIAPEAAGYFLRALLRQIRELRLGASMGELADRLTEELRRLPRPLAGRGLDEHGAPASPEQTPYLVGDRGLVVPEDWHGQLLRLFEFSQRRNYKALTSAEVERRYAADRKALTVPFPPLHLAYGRAFLAKERHEQAVGALQTALAQGAAGPDLVLALAAAHLHLGRFDDAAAALKAGQAALPAAAQGDARELTRQLSRLARGRPRAVLVGITEYTATRSPGGAGRGAGRRSCGASSSTGAASGPVTSSSWSTERRAGTRSSGPSCV